MRHLRLRRAPGLLLVLAAALASAVVLADVDELEAHANVARADPPVNARVDFRPQRVTIWFTEPIAPEFSSIEVLDQSGARVDLGDSASSTADPTQLSVTLDVIEPGAYTVAWRNVSTVDGHSLRGSFAFYFAVEPGAAPVTPEPPLLRSPMEPVVRWLVLLSGLALAGGPLLQRLVLRPTLARTGLPIATSEGIERATYRLAAAALVLFVLSSLAQLWVQAADAGGSPFTLPLRSVLLNTDWGHAWLWRMATTSIAGLALAAHRGWVPGLPEGLRQRAEAIALVALLGALFSITMASHAAATRAVRIDAMVADFVHMVAAASWVGGLFHLFVSIREIRFVEDADLRRRTLAALTPQFSTVAAVSIAALILTGLYSTWVQVTVVRALTTPYGWTLVSKIALFLGLAGLGAINLLWLSRRLRGDERASTLLRRIVAGEVVLGILVVGTVGLLTSIEPARQAQERADARDGLRFEERDGATQVELVLFPGMAGNNTATVTVRDRNGNPVDGAGVELRLTNLDQELGIDTYPTQAHLEGRYVAHDVRMGVAGAWQVEVLVRRPDAFDTQVAFRFDAGSAPTAVIPLSPRTGRLLAIGGLAALGVVLLIAGRLTKRLPTIPAPALPTSGAIALMAALLLMGRVPPETAAMANPILPDSESIARGAELYQTYCVRCHGVTGQGDGPDAAGLQPPPLNLQVHVPLHPDRDIFSFIANGVPGTAMPVFSEVLTDEQMWHLVNYLRSLSTTADR